MLYGKIVKKKGGYDEVWGCYRVNVCVSQIHAVKS